MNWYDFKQRFKTYLITTPGIFTLFDPTPDRFNAFQLDSFIIRRLLNNGHSCLTHIEISEALTCFIDIQESNHIHIDFTSIPECIQSALTTLIDKKVLKLNTCSPLKKHLNSKKPICSAPAA